MKIEQLAAEAARSRPWPTGRSRRSPASVCCCPCNVVVEALPASDSPVWFMDAVAAMGLVGNPHAPMTGERA